MLPKKTKALNMSRAMTESVLDAGWLEDAALGKSVGEASANSAMAVLGLACSELWAPGAGGWGGHRSPPQQHSVTASPPSFYGAVEVFDKGIASTACQRAMIQSVAFQEHTLHLKCPSTDSSLTVKSSHACSRSSTSALAHVILAAKLTMGSGIPGLGEELEAPP